MGIFDKKVKLVSTINHFDSLIATKTSVFGPIDFSGSLKISGSVIGDITGKDIDKNSPTTVDIEFPGGVTGNIEADNVIISGTVNGNISAKSVCISGNAELSEGCTITYDILKIEPGATVHGHLVKRKTTTTPIPLENGKPK